MHYAVMLCTLYLCTLYLCIVRFYLPSLKQISATSFRSDILWTDRGLGYNDDVNEEKPNRDIYLI